MWEQSYLRSIRSLFPLPCTLLQRYDTQYAFDLLSVEPFLAQKAKLVSFGCTVRTANGSVTAARHGVTIFESIAINVRQAFVEAFVEKKSVRSRRCRRRGSGRRQKSLCRKSRRSRYCGYGGRKNPLRSFFLVAEVVDGRSLKLDGMMPASITRRMTNTNAPVDKKL